MKTTWTKRRPRKAGWYWMMVRTRKPEIVDVIITGSGTILFGSVFNYHRFEGDGCRFTKWSGPIEPPK